MKIALFSDVHGNALALERLFKEPAIQEADQHFFLGDAVGYFPDGLVVLRMLQEKKVHCLLGNHDAMAAGLLPLDAERDRTYQIGEQRRLLGSADVDWMRSLSPSHQTDTAGGALLVHGSPENPLEGRLYPDSDATGIAAAGIRYVFCGHTHRPFVRLAGTTTTMNVGSVGLPRDIGNRGCYAIWDTAADAAELHYFVLDTAAMFKAYPQVHPAVTACLRRGT